jgi:transcriptional regulator with GAF, ATPase, and Fis domain
LNGRDEWLAQTFIELADTLVADFDLIEFLSMLAERCVELLGSVEVGLLLASPPDGLQVMASSTERMRMAELLELQYEEGPCLDCYRLGQSVLNQRLDSAKSRWPRFAPIAIESGFRMAHALPLRLRDHVIGAMNVFGTEPNEIDQATLKLVRAFADAATIGILQERTVREHSDLSAQLQDALNSRIVVEQAKGIVAERLRLDMDRAFAAIRDYARSNGLQLSTVASSVVRGSLAAEALRSRSTGRYPAR